MMGVSTVFSLTKIIEREGRAAAVKRVFKRGILLFVVGLIYSGGFTNPWPDMRLMGVLNRIALCYTFGGLLFIFLRARALAAVAAALLLGYWALLANVSFPDVRPTPGGSGVITKEAGFKNISNINLASTNIIHGSYIQGVNLTDYLDQKYLPGRKYDGTYDPEGILSTLPAIVTGLLGIFAGLLIRNKSVPDGKKFCGCSARARRAWRSAGLGNGISGHQKNLDLVLRPRRRRLQRDAARRILLDRGHEKMADVVPAVRLDRHESASRFISRAIFSADSVLKNWPGGSSVAR